MATRESDWTDGFIVFAGLMLILIGFFQVLTGIAAIAENEFFVTAPNYLYEVDVSAWGWIHLIYGIIVIAAGFGIFRGATWARVVGIALASISAIGNFLFIPYQPVWALLIIALDVLVIAALSVRFPQDARMGA